MSAVSPLPVIVIDTNVWLDLLAFDEPSVARLRASFSRVRCIASPAMRAELADVLGRPLFGLSPIDQAEALAVFDGLVDAVAEAPDCRLACSDPDDRMFLDVAVGQRAAWLLTRDKALLKAGRHARRRHGLEVGHPDAFYRWLDRDSAPQSNGGGGR